MVVPGHGEHGPGGARDDVLAGYPAGGLARQALGGEDPAGQPGGGQRLGPRLAGALVDQAGAGGQRRLADRVAAQGEDDPLGHAQPGRARAGAVAAGLQPEQLGQAGLARPRQSGGALEGGSERGGSLGQVLELAAAAVIEPGDRRCDGTGGRVEEHAALGQAGDADGADPDGAAVVFGGADGGADEVHGQASQAVRVDLGLAAGVGLPRGGPLGVLGAVDAGILGRRVTGTAVAAGRMTALAEVVPISMPTTRSVLLVMDPVAMGRPSWAQLPGAARDDPGRDPDALDREAGVGQAGQQPSGGHPADLVAGVVDHGDRGTQGVGHGEVTERDQGDVGAPGGVQGRHHAQRRPDGGAQDGARRAVLADQGGRGAGGVGAGVAVAADQPLVRRDAVLAQGVAVSAQPGGRGGDGGRVAHVGDAAVIVGDEMGHGVERGAVVVDLDQVRGQARGRPVDEHDRHPGVEPGMAARGRAEQEPGDPPPEHALDDIAFPGRVPPRARDQHRPAVRRHLLLDGVDHPGEERVGDRLDHEADRGVRPRTQGPGHRVG